MVQVLDKAGLEEAAQCVNVTEADRKFLQHLLAHGTESLVQDLKCDAEAVRIDDYVFPIIINRADGLSHWPASILSHYFDYAEHEISASVGSRFIRWWASASLRCLRPICARMGVEKTLFVNHWFNTTDQWPHPPDGVVHELVSHLRRTYPDYAYAIRNLNPYWNEADMASLVSAGWAKIYYRPICYLDFRKDDVRRTVLRKRRIRADFALLEDSRDEIVDHDELGEDDVPRLASLFRYLYIDKHTVQNPHYTDEYFRLTLRERFWEFTAIRQNGVLNGFVASRIQGDTLSMPFCGYDTSIPQEEGLYRKLMAIDLQKGIDRKVLAHWSSGAESFKESRGAQRIPDFIMVYTSHLPESRRLAWRALQAGANGPLGLKTWHKYRLK